MGVYNAVNVNRTSQEQLASAMQGLGVASDGAAAIIKTELGAIIIRIMSAVAHGITSDVVKSIEELQPELRPVIAAAIREMKANTERLLIYLESAN